MYSLKFGANYLQVFCAVSKAPLGNLLRQILLTGFGKLEPLELHSQEKGLGTSEWAIRNNGDFNDHARNFRCFEHYAGNDSVL